MLKDTIALLLSLQIVSVASQSIQFSIKDHFFQDVKENYLPMLFEHIGTGYVLGPQEFGNKWASVNLNRSVISLPGMDRQKFTKDFTVIPPKSGASNFGLSMSNMSVQLDSNFAAKFMIASSSGNIHAYIHNINIDLDIELDTQPGFQQESAPKIKVNDVKMSLDKKKTQITISGGVLPWMLNFVESIFQSYMVDYIIKELDTALKTTFQDDLNQIALKYLQTFYLGNQFGFDFSMINKPMDMNNTFMIDLNGTFIHEDQDTKERTYGQGEQNRFSDAQIREIMDHDVAMAIKADTIDSFLDVWYRTNTTISVSELLNKWVPDFKMTCDNIITNYLPNMQFNQNKACKKEKYPFDIQFSLPTKPQKIVVNHDNTGGFIADIRMRAVRTDTQQVLMDFILKTFRANMTLKLDERANINFNYNIRWDDVEIVQRGTRVKSVRDVYFLTNVINNGNDPVNGFINSAFTFRYILGITNRAGGLKLDGDTRTLYFGMTPDPVFIGMDQKAGLI